MPKPTCTSNVGPKLVKTKYTKGINMSIVDVANLTSDLLAFQVIEHNFDRWSMGNRQMGLLGRGDLYSAIFETDATDMSPLTFTVRAMLWPKNDVPVRPEAFDVVEGDWLQTITFKDLIADVEDLNADVEDERSTHERSRAAVTQKVDTIPVASLDPLPEGGMISQAQNENEPASDDHHVTFDEQVSVLKPKEGESGPVEKWLVPGALPPSSPMPNPPPPNTCFGQLNNLQDVMEATNEAFRIMAESKNYDNKVCCS